MERGRWRTNAKNFLLYVSSDTTRLKCLDCGNDLTFKRSEWQGEDPVRIRHYCPANPKREKRGRMHILILDEELKNAEEEDEYAKASIG
jgi:hypothetical protein